MDSGYKIPVGTSVVAMVLASTPDFPNSALPVLQYHAVLKPIKGCVQGEGKVLAHAFEKLFASHAWQPAWRSTIFSFHHFHTTAHECLGIFQGRASVRLGGPQGVLIEALTGDVIIIPAGVAHCLENSAGDFQAVGCYPLGQLPDHFTHRQQAGPSGAIRLAELAIPAQDPVQGEAGALCKLWQFK